MTHVSLLPCTMKYRYLMFVYHHHHGGMKSWLRKVYWKRSVSVLSNSYSSSSSGSSEYMKKREAAEKRIIELPEIQQMKLTENWLESLKTKRMNPTVYNGSMTSDSAELVLKAAFATYLLQVETRVASLIGEGFYTIGPCGEELLGVLGALARESDPVALHYRHLAVQLARQFKYNRGKSTEQILLDRARGPTISTLDPVTGGHHCSLGGGPFDFYVTSTLASQTPPAVGRALAIKLAPRLLGKTKTRFPNDAVSIVSVGDGSVNNSMFLSAVNFARYAQHRNFKCPLLIVISDNDISISLRGHGYITKFVHSIGLEVFKASGNGDMLGLWDSANRALSYARMNGRPAILVVNELKRRFGHAATDRQNMYLTPQEITSAAAEDPVRVACEQALAAGLINNSDLYLKWWYDLKDSILKAFIQASSEPKIISREQVIEKNFPPLYDHIEARKSSNRVEFSQEERKKFLKPQPMRVLMNSCFKELMTNDHSIMYIGEDVRHGGYYRVTEDFASLFPERIQDVPPDETSLVGLAIGYSQSGLVPICEIPYAKYLDCAADMFFESVLTHWCTSGRQRDGIVFRVQGFDKGVFGGNFHTHNSIYLPPGLDVVCYSNGRDYVRGMRYAVLQAKKAGRVVMSLDCTDLLYRRGIVDEDLTDSSWMNVYPFDDGLKEDESLRFLDFETVILYPDVSNASKYLYYGNRKPNNNYETIEEPSSPDLIICTYGNGLPTSFRAARSFKKGKIFIVDCPTLGRSTKGLEEILSKYKEVPVVFADICKAGQHPFGAVIYQLLEKKGQRKSLLEGRQWSCVAAPATYNPLGVTITFLNEKDIIDVVKPLLS